MRCPPPPSNTLARRSLLGTAGSRRRSRRHPSPPRAAIGLQSRIVERVSRVDRGGERPAASSGVSTRCSSSTRASRTRKKGRLLTPKPTRLTPSSSRRSTVAAGSMIDLGPLHTRSPGVRESSTRSALTSGCSPGCTPPIPPVALTAIPARAAAQIVADTVVAPRTPRAQAAGRSRRATLSARPGSVNGPSSSSERPTTTSPASTPTHAGTASAPRIAPAMRSMHSRCGGAGVPGRSRSSPEPTTARRSASADATSAPITEPSRSRRHRRPHRCARRHARSGPAGAVERVLRALSRERATRARRRRTHRPPPWGRAPRPPAGIASYSRPSRTITAPAAPRFTHAAR